MLVKTYAGAVHGVDARTITIETNTGGPMIGPEEKSRRFGLSDCLTAPCGRVSPASRQPYRSSGIRTARLRTIINLAPADIRKEGTAFDLPIALGMLAGAGLIASDGMESVFYHGRTFSDGSLRPIKGALSIAIQARKRNSRASSCPG
jgi:magnesium chelatase family protein